MKALGSHNSWSFLSVRRWWMKPLAFTARCQRKTIQEQYALGVRCFDFRVRFEKDKDPIIAHGIVEYSSFFRAMGDIWWLEQQGEPVYIRVIHEARNKKEYTDYSVMKFQRLCESLEKNYNMHFWCGRNLYNWEYDYRFSTTEPTCEEKYASVCAPMIVDDWWPYLYAKRNNHAIVEAGTDKTILLIDFVDIR